MHTLELSHQLYSAFSRGDFPELLACLSEDVEWHLIGPTSIPYFGRYQGKAGVQRFLSTLLEHEEVLEFVPQQFIDGGSSVVVLGHERCRAKATQREYKAQWAQVFESQAGLITSWTEYIDTAAIEAAYADQ